MYRKQYARFVMGCLASLMIMATTEGSSLFYKGGSDESNGNGDTPPRKRPFGKENHPHADNNDQAKKGSRKKKIPALVLPETPESHGEAEKKTRVDNLSDGHGLIHQLSGTCNTSNCLDNNGYRTPPRVPLARPFSPPATPSWAWSPIPSGDGFHDNIEPLEALIDEQLSLNSSPDHDGPVSLNEDHGSILDAVMSGDGHGIHGLSAAHPQEESQAADPVHLRHTLNESDLSELRSLREENNANADHGNADHGNAALGGRPLLIPNVRRRLDFDGVDAQQGLVAIPFFPQEQYGNESTDDEHDDSLSDNSDSSSQQSDESNNNFLDESM